MQEKRDPKLRNGIIYTTLTIALGLMLTQCGYTLNHRLKETFDAKGKGVFIPVFTNQTEEVNLGIVFTNALIRELESHGEKNVSKKENAGLEIRGVITDVTQKLEIPSTANTLYDYSQVPDQIGVRVYMRIEIWDPVSNQKRWENRFEQYRRVSAPLNRLTDKDAPSSLGPITQSIIEASYPDIARDIMRDVYDLMVDL